MKVKVSELEGRALNWAVAYVKYGQSRYAGNWHCFDTGIPDEPQVIVREKPKAIQDDEYNPSGNWAHGGPLIESACISVFYHNQPDMGGNMWYGACGRNSVHKLPRCKSPLVAACRAYVFSCVREEIEIPDELMEASHA
ncbi:MAG: hypothetical protein CMO04_04985 [Thalassospira sp.]|uniref:phage protein NinX family protein n=1 Tax=Thalassospira sp. TaxID=1912094 RepID=UPI000C4F5857|nr:phage protein NinX family protein [Thalassospira sp.]MAL39222.1 hypothetical protein [Thalassospira sp.]